jgi:hypothetical protein
MVAVPQWELRVTALNPSAVTADSLCGDFIPTPNA